MVTLEECPLMPTTFDLADMEAIDASIREAVAKRRVAVAKYNYSESKKELLNAQKRVECEKQSYQTAHAYQGAVANPSMWWAAHEASERASIIVEVRNKDLVLANEIFSESQKKAVKLSRNAIRHFSGRNRGTWKMRMNSKWWDGNDQFVAMDDGNYCYKTRKHDRDTVLRREYKYATFCYEAAKVATKTAAANLAFATNCQITAAYQHQNKLNQNVIGYNKTILNIRLLDEKNAKRNVENAEMRLDAHFEELSRTETKVARLSRADEFAESIAANFL